MECARRVTPHESEQRAHSMLTRDVAAGCDTPERSGDGAALRAALPCRVHAMEADQGVARHCMPGGGGGGWLEASVEASHHPCQAQQLPAPLLPSARLERVAAHRSGESTERRISTIK